MISENIRKYRKEKGLSQEGLAEKLHVVRQTVSKWENGLSLPDAEVLVRMAEALGVSVHQLVGTEEPLGRELACANESLERCRQQEQNVRRVNQKRNTILFLSFSGMLLMLIVKNELVSMILAGGCMLAAVCVLYRNLTLLTEAAGDLKAVKVTTVFDIAVLVVGMAASFLFGGKISPAVEKGEAWFAMLLVCGVILFGGFISPRLPFNRHTGLRLPWTVQDEAAWNVAHRMIGMISLPLVLLYVAAACTIPHFEAVTLTVVLAWVGIPGMISLVSFWINRYKDSKKNLR